jgi:hypothetical protein
MAQKESYLAMARKKSCLTMAQKEAKKNCFG